MTENKAPVLNSQNLPKSGLAKVQGQIVKFKRTGDGIKLYRLNLFDILKIFAMKMAKTIAIVFKRIKRFFLRLYLTHKYRRQSKQDSTMTVQPIRKRVYRDKCRQRYYESGCYNLRKAMAKRHMKRGKSCEEAWELAKAQISRVVAHKWKAWGI